jgi:hypothetical protein
MFGQPRTQNPADGDIREPLLNGSRRVLADDRTIFSVTGDDDDDVEEVSALDPQSQQQDSARTVSFQEDVHVIVPSLRSTIESREAGV